MKYTALLVVLAVGGSSIAIAEEVTPARKQSPPIVASSGTDWVGVAVSPNRRVFRVGDSNAEDQARSSARTECERTTGRTCSAIAVPDGWDVVVVHCSSSGRSGAFLGGSTLGNAEQIARDKADDAGFNGRLCDQIYTN
jgi:hypothetical protein